MKSFPRYEHLYTITIGQDSAPHPDVVGYQLNNPFDAHNYGSLAPVTTFASYRVAALIGSGTQPSLAFRLILDTGGVNLQSTFLSGLYIEDGSGTFRAFLLATAASFTGLISNCVIWTWDSGAISAPWSTSDIAENRTVRIVRG